MQKGIPVPHKRAQQCLGKAIFAGVIFGCGKSTSITLGTVPGVHNDIILRFQNNFNYYIMDAGDCQPVSVEFVQIVLLRGEEVRGWSKGETVAFWKKLRKNFPAVVAGLWG